MLFSTGWNTGLFSSGKTEPFSTLDTAAGEMGHWWPQVLPGEKTVLFTVWMAASGINDSRIAVLDVATRKHRILMPGALGRYLPSGQLLYFHAGEYHTVRFDPVSLQTSADRRTVLDDARALNPSGATSRPVAVSANGTLAYIPGPLFPDRTLAWVKPGGVVERIDLPARPFASGSLSPDGRHLMTDRVDGGMYGVWSVDLERRTEQKIDLPGASMAPCGARAAIRGHSSQCAPVTSILTSIA